MIMQQRTIPKTGESLPVLGFGCMRLPLKNGRIDEDAAIRLIRMAVDRGVTYLDTAWPYHGGQSEPLVGRAMRDGYRQKVKLATKLPQWLVKSREDMDVFLNAQLEKLETDHIDYYLVHSIGRESWEKMKNLGIRDFLDTALTDGRIRFAGFSFHEDVRSFRTIVDEYNWDFCQIQYNILDENTQAGREGLLYAAGKGLGVIIMEPLRGGSLARTPPPEVQAIWDSAPVHHFPAEWALKWLLDQPEVTTILSGMNEENQLIENIATAVTTLPGSLTGEERSVITRAVDTYRALMKVSCTGCQYCMPCPAGVNIPGCFDLYNSYYLFENKWFTKVRYALWLGGVMGARSMASRCIRCNRCLSSCPQHILIPDRLSNVASLLEGPLFILVTRLAPVLIPVMRRIELFRSR